MLKTFFVWSFIAFPLAIALAWIIYRARFFLIGMLGIALAISLIWGVLKLGQGFDAATQRPATPVVEQISCRTYGTDAPALRCGG